MTDKSVNGEQEAGPQHDDAALAEAQRLAARRRFLKGGAIALPLIVSISRETFAHDRSYNHNHYGSSDRKVGRSLCASIGVKKKSTRNTHYSTVCRIRNS